MTIFEDCVPRAQKKKQQNKHKPENSNTYDWNDRGACKQKKSTLQISKRMLNSEK